MEFIVEYYQTEGGRRPVEEFIDELFATNPGDAASIFAGIEKLKQRSNHREPLTKAIGDDLFELRHVGKLNTRVLWFYVKGRRIIAVHGIRNKGQKIPSKGRSGAEGRLGTEKSIMTETNFDRHLAKHLKDPKFAELFRKADAAWDIALQLSKLRQDAGLSQAQLARKLKTSQQQISRLESANYEGHSLSMLRRVAEALNARVIVTFEPADGFAQVNEAPSRYKSSSKRGSAPRKAAAKESAQKSPAPKKKDKATRSIRKGPTKKTAKKITRRTPAKNVRQRASRTVNPNPST